MISHRQQQRQKKQKSLAIILLSGCLLLVIGIGGFKFWLSAHQPKFDPDSFCPDSGPTGYTAILIDSTDPYNLVQQSYLNKYFNTFISEMPLSNQVTLFVVGPSSYQVPEPLLRLCNPGDGKSANPVISNPKLLQSRWETRFLQPLSQALKVINNQEMAKTSPIMEMIQAVSIHAFPLETNRPKRLIIVSDMLQNTDGYSHYRATADFAQFRNNPYLQRVQTDLSNVQVTILYKGNADAGKRQNKGHALFWAEYVNHMGGELELIQRIDG